jgi:dethiobiotin synthetase
MTKRLFITGTDTEVGKTWVAAQLMREIARAGIKVAGLKPVAAGIDAARAPDKVNEDAVLLQSLATQSLPYEAVNPLLLTEAIAPHIAAAKEGVGLSVGVCVKGCQKVLKSDADVVVIEGAGGWLVPLNATETMADLANALDCDVILVVGMRLGCINHALLSAQALLASGVSVVGWVANSVDPEMLCPEENLNTLIELLPMPLLAQIPHNAALQNSYFESSVLHSLCD